MLRASSLSDDALASRARSTSAWVMGSGRPWRHRGRGPGPCGSPARAPGNGEELVVQARVGDHADKAVVRRHYSGRPAQVVGAEVLGQEAIEDALDQGMVRAAEAGTVAPGGLDRLQRRYAREPQPKLDHAAQGTRDRLGGPAWMYLEGAPRGSPHLGAERLEVLALSLQLGLDRGRAGILAHRGEPVGRVPWRCRPPAPSPCYREGSRPAKPASGARTPPCAPESITPGLRGDPGTRNSGSEPRRQAAGCDRCGRAQ